MDIGAVVVTHNSASHLSGLIETLSCAVDGEDRIRVVAVDSASTDDSVSVAKSLGIDVIVMARNRGFAAGINEGSRALGPKEALLVLNPDVRLAAGCVSVLAKELRDPGVGIVAPRLVAPGGGIQSSIRRDPSVLRAWAAALIGGRRAGKHERFGEIDTVASHYDAVRDVDWVTGATLLISERCSQAVGLWDESFFLYSEEVDFCQRARECGFRVRYTPAAQAEHAEGDYSSPLSASLVALNAVRLYRRRHSLPATIAYYVGVLLGCALRAHRPSQRAAWRALVRPSARPVPVRGQPLFRP